MNRQWSELVKTFFGTMLEYKESSQTTNFEKKKTLKDYLKNKLRLHESLSVLAIYKIREVQWKYQYLQHDICDP